MNTRDLWLRIRALVLGRRVERELHEELNFHLEMATRKNVESGLSGAEAGRRARGRFGPRALIEDQCRDARGLTALAEVRQDVHYAARSFRRSPTFALTVIGTIALGLGLNAAVFMMFNAYVLRPLAVRDPFSLYAFTWKTQGGRFHAFSRAEYEQFRQENRVFSDLFAARKQVLVRIDGHVVYGTLVSAEYFPTLGVDAAIGRTLGPHDAADGAAAVVLSHAFWRRHFAADPSVVGRTLSLRGHPYEVVGVLPERFAGLDVLPHDFWIPLSAATPLIDGDVRLEVVGRLKPEVTLEAAEAALAPWAAAMTARGPADRRAVSVLLESRATSIPRTPLTFMLFGPILVAFALVMLIACANVANMMLARGLSRQREIGIRMSLGASRARVVRQLLTESLLLAIPAALAALVISQWTVDAGVRLLFATMPAEYAEYIRLAPLAVDVRVAAFMSAAAIGSAVLFGLVPALESTRPGLVRAARGEFMYDVRPGSPRNGLVVVQITASVCLLICAAILLRGSNRFSGVETGLRTRDVIEIYIREQSRPRVLQALRSIPAVAEVGAVSSVPLDASPPRAPVRAARETVLVSAGYRFASPEFFSVFDIRVIAGRPFTAAESVAEADVAIVSRTAARRLWPEGNAIGQVLSIAAEPGTVQHGRILRHASARVVGISADIASGYLDSDADKTAFYLPASTASAGTVLLTRVTGDVEAARRELDMTLTAADPAAIERIHKMQALVVGRQYPLRLAYGTSIVVGALALLLTVSGVYGLLSSVVMQRSKELGIRRALGAPVSAVTGLVLKQSLRLALYGLAFGGLLAAGASRVLAARMIKVDSLDTAAYLSGMLVVLAACIAAACVPALRAARIEPMAALRHD